MYIDNQSGKAFKLEGLDKDGYFIWSELPFEKYNAVAFRIGDMIIVDYNTSIRIKDAK